MPIKIPDLKFAATYVGMHTDKAEGDSKPWRAFEWKIRLTRGDRSFETSYKQGLAHCKHASRKPAGQPSEANTPELARTFKPYGRLTIADCEGFVIPTPPTLPGVLESLQSDSHSGAHLLFEDFASKLGYDTDSRKAETIWRACQTIRGELQHLLGSEFEAFDNADPNADPETDPSE
jgi:hypothetical protein